MIVVRGNRHELESLHAHLTSREYSDDSVEWPTMNFFLVMYEDSDIINREKLVNFSSFEEFEKPLVEYAEEVDYELRYTEA